MYDFRTDWLVLDNQLGDLSLGKTISSHPQHLTIKEKEAEGHEFERDQEGGYMGKDVGRKGKMM